MAAMGAVRLPVHLSVGDTTAEVGTLVFDIVPRGEENTTVRAALAELLHGIADQIAAEGVPDADHRS